MTRKDATKDASQRRRPLKVVVMVLVVAACSGANSGGDGDGTSAPAASAASPLTTATTPATAIVPEVEESMPTGCADVVGVDVKRADDGTYRFDVTVSSPDEGWDKYADEWQVRSGETVLGTRVLAHPHVDEQPFTRSLTGVVVPEGVDEVLVRARDSVTGYCGEEIRVTIPT